MRQEIAIDIGHVTGDCSVEILYRRRPEGSIEVVEWHQWQHDLELKANDPVRQLSIK